MTAETNHKMFMDDLFWDAEDAVKRLRVVRDKIPNAATKDDAEHIERTLLRLAEKLAANGLRSKPRFEILRKST